MDIETTLKRQRRDPIGKYFNERVTGNSCPVTETPIITASPFMLEYYRSIPNLQNGEHT